MSPLAFIDLPLSIGRAAL